MFIGLFIIRKGKPNPHVRAVCYNHTTALDILVTAGTGAWSAISKAGIAKNPIFGTTLRVTRSFLARANQGHDELKNRLTEKPMRFPPLGVFPAGTTTNQKVQIRFRTGIFLHNPQVQIGTLEYKGYENIFYANSGGPRMIWNIVKSPFMICKITYYPDVEEPLNGEEA